ncbi:unnamed protein product, partial [Ixodes persulcatus]
MLPTPPTTRVVENLVYFTQRLQIPHCLCISFACADDSSRNLRSFGTERTRAAVSAHLSRARPSSPFHRGVAMLLTQKWAARLSFLAVPHRRFDSTRRSIKASSYLV